MLEQLIIVFTSFICEFELVLSFRILLWDAFGIYTIYYKLIYRLFIIIQTILSYNMSSEVFCALHPNKILDSYCETCKDAVCQLCRSLNPHSNSLHDVVSIEDAAKVRKLHFQAYLYNQINPLRQKIQRKLIQLKNYDEQVLKNEKKVIAKDIKIEFQGIEQRLKKKMEEQIIKCQTSISFYQQYINDVDDLSYSFDSVKEQPYKFLIVYRQLNEKLLKIEAIQIKESKQGSANKIRLPRQIAQVKEKAALLQKYKAKNKFVNELILKCVEDYHAQIQKAKSQAQGNQKRIRHLYNDYNNEILKLQAAKVCAYCLATLTPSQINQPCPQNKTVRSTPAYSDIIVPQISRGGRLHYWVTARKTQRGYPSLSAHVLVRMAMKKQFFSSLNDLKQVKCQLHRYEIKEQLATYKSLFQAHDPEKKGLISRIAFLYLMTNKFQVEQVHAQTIIQLLKGEGDSVKYAEMDSLLEDPLKLYHKFVEEEEEMEKVKPIAPVSKFKY